MNVSLSAAVMNHDNGGSMSTDLLERIGIETEQRLNFLEEAVEEADILGKLLDVLGPPMEPERNGRSSSKPAAQGITALATPGAPAAPTKARRKRRKNRKGKPLGQSDPVVLAALEGLSTPVDVKTVAEKTGLSPNTSAYTLKKLASKGALTQSTVPGLRGRSKLVFLLTTTASNSASAGASTSATPPAPPSAAPKRKARRKAARKSSPVAA
jgi:hypothetical protein